MTKGPSEVLPHERFIHGEFERCSAQARTTLALFESDAPVEKLQEAADLLSEAYSRLLKSLPSGVEGGDAQRHLWFIRHFLGKGQPESCKKDVRDIVDADLPALLRAFDVWASGMGQYDERLRLKVLPLLEQQQYDSAIRAAFVHLKARLVYAFKLPRTLDGEKLYNRVLGSGGPLTGALDGSERESLRAMIGALHRLFRHVHAHDEVASEWYEVETALVGVNFLLRRVESALGHTRSTPRIPD